MSADLDKSLLVIGECMMELAGQEESYQRAFAGDVYNTAVYAKRFQQDINVQILTAVGHDPISAAMRAQWDRDLIGHSLVLRSREAHPGIYAINTDKDGERSFTYWRKASAATELMSLLTAKSRTAIAEYAYVYFSGISLAILPDDDKSALLDLLSDLRTQGTTIAFDPNYRSALWINVDHARHWLTAAYRLTDIALPGLFDHQEVYGSESSEDVRSHLEDLGVQEIVVKAGKAGVFGYAMDQINVHTAISQVPNPLDTTGAGDSFAGTFLAARLCGASMTEALKDAVKVASLVITHHGAIVDENTYRKFIDKDP